MDDDRPFATVQWRYKKLASLDSLSLIYELDDKGAIVSFADNPSHTQFADRIEFKGDIAKKDFTLAIRNFVKDDEGVFSCSVRGAALFEREVTVKAMGMLKYVVHTIMTSRTALMTFLGVIFSAVILTCILLKCVFSLQIKFSECSLITTFQGGGLVAVEAQTRRCCS